MATFKKGMRVRVNAIGRTGLFICDLEGQVGTVQLQTEVGTYLVAFDQWRRGHDGYTEYTYTGPHDGRCWFLFPDQLEPLVKLEIVK